MKLLEKMDLRVGCPYFDTTANNGGNRVELDQGSNLTTDFEY